MQKAIVRRTFDVVRNQRQEPIYAAKGDYGARYIQAIITADGVPYAIPENAIVTINAFRRDGKSNRFKGTVNADGSVIVPITQWMLDILGMVACTISAVEEGGMLTTENFYVVVNESSTDVEVSTDDPQYDLLTEVLLNEQTREKEFDEMVKRINSMEQGKAGDTPYVGDNGNWFVGDQDTGVSSSGIHIGPEAPTDGQVAWIDTNEEPSEEEGGANFDITAKPGQVIAVKAVDVEGKPKEYKAVNLPVAVQPDLAANEGEPGHVANRTHFVDANGVVHKLPNKYIDADWMATSWEYISQEIVIPEQNVSSGMWKNRQMDIRPGITYDVHINGVVYPCVASNDEDGGIILGNNTSLTLNNIPFCIFFAGGTATSGFFYKDSGVLSDPVNMKVTGHSYKNYNKLPKEFLPEVSWNDLTDKPLVDGLGELLFSHTVTFDTDAAAYAGVDVAGAALQLLSGTKYWLDVNGKLLSCYGERDSIVVTILYDEDHNEWMRTVTSAVHVSAPKAGTYTYKLYETSENLMFDPEYLPPQSSTGGGSASIDVTAEVGQTIIVKEVDKNGKPTKWESADYQPRTHWTEETEIFPETTVELTDGAWEGEAPNNMEIGRTYKVIWNGTEYTCVAKDGAIVDYAGAVVIGNTDAALGTGDTGEPFIIGTADGYGIMMDMTGSASVTLSIVCEVATQIPQKYLTSAFPYYIEVTGRGTDDDPYVCNDTVANVNAIFESGRPLSVKWKYTENYIIYEHRIPCIQRMLTSVTIYCFGLWFNSSTVTNSVFFKLMSQSDGTFVANRKLGFD